jgi:hypothetical protein
MTTDTLTMLRVLTDHIEQHDLAEHLKHAEANYDDFYISAFGPDGSMVATLNRWARSLGEIAFTAEPSGHGHVVVTMTGHLGDHPLKLVWIAAGGDAAGLRHLLGLSTRPPTSLSLDALAGLTTTAAA